MRWRWCGLCSRWGRFCPAGWGSHRALVIVGIWCCADSAAVYGFVAQLAREAEAPFVRVGVVLASSSPVSALSVESCQPVYRCLARLSLPRSYAPAFALALARVMPRVCCPVKLPRLLGWCVRWVPGACGVGCELYWMQVVQDAGCVRRCRCWFRLCVVLAAAAFCCMWPRLVRFYVAVAVFVVHCVLMMIYLCAVMVHYIFTFLLVVFA